ncbi:MAG: sigma-70 family RNA polymerase sigma factor [Candidatus Methylomirabilia bacterium]
MATNDRGREFEQAALVHLDRVFQLALRLCGNRAEAQDLAQETFLRAFRHFDQFDPGTNCRAWLFAILRNTFINRVKRQGRELLGLEDGASERREGESSEMTAAIASPEEEFFRHVVDSDVLAALERLPLSFREVVLLADVEECSYKEIGQICGLPLGTVMSRLFRGRQMLRQALVAAGRERRGIGREA